MFIRLKLTGIWCNPNFRKLWISQTISVFGSAVTSFALPLTASLTLQATPTQMGFLRVVQYAPFLLFSLIAGVWADRLPHRSILIGTNLCNALLLGTIPVFAILDKLCIEYLYVTTFFMSVFTLFFDIAYFAFLPSLIQREQLVEGNSKITASWSVAQIVAPGVSSALVNLVPIPVLITLDAFSFLLSVLFLRLIYTSKLVLPQPSLHQSIWHEIGEGLHMILNNPLLRSITACTSTLFLFRSMVLTVYILYVTRELNIGPTVFGIISMIGACGSFLGAMLIERAIRKFGLGATIVWSAFGWSIGYLPVSIVTGTQQITAPLLAIAGILAALTEMVYYNSQLSLRQAIIPVQLQGRVSASMRFITWGILPVGSFLGGILGETINLRATLVVGVLGMSLAFLWVLFSPVRKLHELPIPIEEQ